jgi:hypothetical protein
MELDPSLTPNARINSKWLGIVAHIYNLSAQSQWQEDREFETSQPT